MDPHKAATTGGLTLFPNILYKARYHIPGVWSSGVGFEQKNEFLMAL